MWQQKWVKVVDFSRCSIAYIWMQQHIYRIIVLKMARFYVFCCSYNNNIFAIAVLLYCCIQTGVFLVLFTFLLFSMFLLFYALMPELKIDWLIDNCIKYLEMFARLEYSICVVLSLMHILQCSMYILEMYSWYVYLLVMFSMINSMIVL